MMEEITAISVPLPYKLGTVNCYLIRAGAGYVPIDTGYAKQRVTLERELERAGCRPFSMKLLQIG